MAEDTHADTDTTSTDTSLRYAAYATRVRTLLQASHRYVAYTSDIGESFRPVAHPALVSAAYAVSWTYLVGDVSYEAWRAKRRSDDDDDGAAAADWKLVAAKRALFQGVASMALPAATIHSTVRYSSLLFARSTSKRLRTYGPVALGLAVVPFLPYVFDEPVEHAVDALFGVLVPESKPEPKAKA